jgi:HAD superfamily hydrolase (TIGR01450 family)
MATMAWVLDLDGVVWLAGDAIAGAATAIRRLRHAGEQLVFVTNNSFSRPADVARRLEGIGIDAAADDVVTSAAAAARLLTRGERVLVCGGPGVVEAVEQRGCRVVEVDAIGEGLVDAVVVGYDPAFDYSRMTSAAPAVRDGARLVATNDDGTYPTPAGPIPGAGAILASIVTASNTSPVVAGKPHEAMRELVLARCGRSGVVVGDRPDTDGRFAVALGYAFGLVLSGVTSKADLPVDPSPDLVADDLQALVDDVLG